MVLAKMTGLVKGYLIASCLRKKPYTLFKAIIKVINTPTERLNIYKCRFCNNYHVGHLSKRAKYMKNRMNRIPRLTLIDIRG